MQLPKILLDTDLGGDCDDVGAIALLNVFANRKEAEILGITHSTSLEWGPACIDIINRFYGRSIDLGAYAKKGFLDGPQFNRYAEKLAMKFSSPYLNRSLATEATKYLRTKLLSLKNEKCKLVGIGQLNNLADLLRSSGCDASSKSGYEIIKDQVEEVVLMGGMFPNNDERIYFHGKEYQTEYNIVSDIPSAQYFIANCPVSITFIDFIIGYQVKTIGRLLELGNMDNPVTFSYYHYCNSSRESWDLIAIYYAVRGLDDVFAYSDHGIVTVDDEGKTHFKPCETGKHRYLRLVIPEGELAKRIDDLILSDRI